MQAREGAQQRNATRADPSLIRSPTPLVSFQLFATFIAAAWIFLRLSGGYLLPRRRRRRTPKATTNRASSTQNPLMRL